MPGLLYREGVSRRAAMMMVVEDSDPDLGSDDDGCSREEELGRSDTRMNVPCEAIDGQRLRAWKEGKSWGWIFKKFPGRTPAAVRTRLNIVQTRGE